MTTPAMDTGAASVKLSPPVWAVVASHLDGAIVDCCPLVEHAIGARLGTRGDLCRRLSAYLRLAEALAFVSDDTSITVPDRLVPDLRLLAEEALASARDRHLSELWAAVHAQSNGAG